MTYATILLHYGFEGTPDARLRLAKGLADRFNATLIGAASRALTPIVVEGILAPIQMGAAEYKDLQDLLADQQAKFVKSTQGKAYPADWKSGLEPPTAFLARESRSADLILIEQHARTGNLYESLDPAGLILSAGRPVLAIPNNAAPLSAKVVVAGWKDTRESRRAIQDSLPFLREAERVYVVGVLENAADEDTKQGIDEVCRYLARHQVKAHPRLIASTEKTPAEELIQVARTEGADLIVAGAYGRSRVGEWIFGGVTRDLLRTSPVCCLFSH
jgi:nucleotide-binding universal stress UspA family protein